MKKISRKPYANTKKKVQQIYFTVSVEKDPEILTKNNEMIITLEPNRSGLFTSNVEEVSGNITVTQLDRLMYKVTTNENKDSTASLLFSITDIVNHITITKAVSIQIKKLHTDRFDNVIVLYDEPHTNTGPGPR